MPSILPSVSLYIRITNPDGIRRYERVRTRNPQLDGGIYCLHYYEDGRRRWLAVGDDLRAHCHQRRVPLRLLAEEILLT